MYMVVFGFGFLIATLCLLGVARFIISVHARHAQKNNNKEVPSLKECPLCHFTFQERDSFQKNPNYCPPCDGDNSY